MTLQIKPINRDSSYLEAVQNLNNEAFNDSVRLPLNSHLALAEQEKTKFVAFYDGEQFVGFCSFSSNAHVVYLEYLAINQSLRSKGYGSQALAKIKALHPTKQLVLDIKRVDEQEAADIERRIARKAFYLRNGYHETGYCLLDKGASFEVLCDSASFDSEHFSEVLRVPDGDGETGAMLKLL